MNDLCTDIGFASLNKFGEQLCGDHVEVAAPDGRSIVAVLADGLGSGVKACILSTLTAKIISTLMAEGLPVEECVAAIAATLPICRERQIAYSTFTIIRITNSQEAEIIRYDNPPVILLRQGKNCPYPQTEETIDGKVIFKSRIKLAEDDTFIALSDGAVHAGTGRSLNLNWQQADITAFLETLYDRDYTAKTLSALLLGQCETLYGGRPGDDTTVCAVKIRPRKAVNLLFGPPASPDDVGKMMALFFAKEGRHIVCGGTTSILAAKFLGQPLDTGHPLHADPEIPPVASIRGVDLVTEGVITISKVLADARDFLAGAAGGSDWSFKQDGASQIDRLLLEEATDVHFFVGQAVNPAHRSPGMPVGFSIKTRLAEDLADCLRHLGKKTKISYF